MFSVGDSVKFTNSVYDSKSGIDVPAGTYGNVTRVSGDDVWVQIRVSSGWFGGDSPKEVKATRWDIS
jgi:hypothetical protein